MTQGCFLLLCNLVNLQAMTAAEVDQTLARFAASKNSDATGK
jgi:hypothetical protein